MRNYPSIGVQVADILLPRKGIDLQKWATIACDQFTSQPEYWQQVENIVDSAPSTFNLILPEVYLGSEEEVQRIQSVQRTMHEYLNQGIFETYTGLIYVERYSLGKLRRVIVLALDLENYDFKPGSQSLIRATEGTILERLPPRMRIREGAALELPHILVLIDDPERTVIEPIASVASDLPLLYDFELMPGSGHLSGRLVDQPNLEAQVVAALEYLASPEVFYPKYGVSKEHGRLLFAVGDGNHSLATAKAIWEKIKPAVGLNHPARYALVEVENVHDEGLIFEPIHRLILGVKQNPAHALEAYFRKNIQFMACSTVTEMVEKVEIPQGDSHKFGFISQDGYNVVTIRNPVTNLPVGTLQSFIDAWLKEGAAEKIDYVHGIDVVLNLATQSENCGFYLPPMPKDALFKTVIVDGALPRKTFSMGEAVEKRFYMEARRIA
jgi:hypothetical protein